MHTFLIILIIVLSLVALIITIFNMPGVWLVYLGYIIWAFYTDFTDVSVSMLFIMFAVSLFVSIIDNLTALLGVKKYGASKIAIFASVVGAFLGLIISGPVGMIFFSLIATVLAELIFSKKDINKALKSGLGVVVGLVAGIAIKFVAVAGMVVYLFSHVFVG